MLIIIIINKRNSLSTYIWIATYMYMSTITKRIGNSII